jgi:hypothetical protein
MNCEICNKLIKNVNNHKKTKKHILLQSQKDKKRELHNINYETINTKQEIKLLIEKLNELVKTL